MLTIPLVGRKPIQIGGFGMLTILFMILAWQYHWLIENNIPLFITLYTLIQFFNNFGPNTTTFVMAGEVFPTRYISATLLLTTSTDSVLPLMAYHRQAERREPFLLRMRLVL